MLLKNTKIKNNIFIKLPKKDSKKFSNLEFFIYKITEKALNFLLKTESLIPPLEVSILIVNKNKMQILNKKYRNQNKPTDVLSFSQLEGEMIPKEKFQPTVLGDIVICLPVAIEQAKENQSLLYQEILRLIIHGLYHLLGYDHERSKEDKVLMEKKEKRLRNYLLKDQTLKKLIAQ